MPLEPILRRQRSDSNGMLSTIRKVLGLRKPFREMSAVEGGEYISKKYPITVRHGEYIPPEYRCSRWLLINGPIYADEGFTGTVIVEVSKLVGWMTAHAKGVFSSDVAEQQAREFLPGWLRDADPHDEKVTLLDEQQREVLQGDCLRFLWNDWAKVWCPTCKSWHSRIKEHDFGWAQTGRITLRFDDWHCPEGHLINKEKQEAIRLIIR